ncbi:MAG TPA: hypothetical protein DIC32_10255 [Acinetobacter radioresistens]|uniref:Transcriptional regulator n=1 Tax=Acinetobacter radioresistens TaxID=40216 RepID=A0A3D3G2N7_ACIRA|nr:hypothetical protein [Acinetobacter radioresistens]
MRTKSTPSNKPQREKVQSLLAYLKDFSSDKERKNFAKECGTTPGNLSQIAYGGSVSAKLAKTIHEKSEQKVLLEELRPDIFA